MVLWNFTGQAGFSGFFTFPACRTASRKESKNLNPYFKELILIFDNPILNNSSSDCSQYTEIS